MTSMQPEYAPSAMLQDGSVKNVGYTGDPHVYFSILYAKGGTLKETNFLFIGKDLNYGMLRNIKKSTG